MPPRVEHTWRDWNQGDKFTRPYPQKRPASVDLQASKKSKGLQVQQFQYHSNMRALGGLTISIKYTHKYGLSPGTQALQMCVFIHAWTQRVGPQNRSAFGLSAARTDPHHGEKMRARSQLVRWRKYPIEGQNSQKPGLRYFSVPAASRAVAGNFLFAEHLHRVVFRERRPGALPLQIDIVPTFGARKHNSVGFTHNL